MTTHTHILFTDILATTRVLYFLKNSNSTWNQRGDAKGIYFVQIEEYVLRYCYIILYLKGSIIFPDKIISISQGWSPRGNVVQPVFIRRPKFTRQRTTPQTNGEEKCARLQRKTLQGRTPDAHPYVLADIQQVTDTDVARTISYILCPTNRQGCIDRNAKRWGGRRRSIVFPERSRTHEKKKKYCTRSLFLCAGQTENRITSVRKILVIASVEPRTRITSISATVKQLLDVLRKT